MVYCGEVSFPSLIYLNIMQVVTMVLWVFGYGSLIWNPGFEFDEKIVGFIKDYRRVFDLGKIYLFVKIWMA